MQKTSYVSFIILLSGIIISSCNKSDSSDLNTTDSSSASELVSSSVSGAVSSSSSTGSLTFLEKQNNFKEYLTKFLTNYAYAANSCPTPSSTACTGNNIVLTYSNCNFGSSAATWNGSQTLTFTSGCGWTPGAVTFTRTFSSGTTRTSAAGVVVTLDTTNASGYSSQVSGGSTITVSAFPARTIVINGIHLTATVISQKGKTITLWDHTISSGTITVTAGLGVTGTVTLQHNLAKYTATSTLNLTYTTGCVHPTSGTITTTLSGSKRGTETLTFSSNCGQATLTNTSNSQSTVNIAHIF